jgi:hypothetical protein
VLGPVSLIWDCARRELQENHEAAWEWVHEYIGSLSIYEDIDEFDAHDPRQLGLLNPSSLKTLLDTEDRPLIAKYFPKINSMLILQRNLASSIPRDEAGTRHCNLQDKVKPFYIRTRPCERKPEEEAEFQYLHREAAK